MFNLVKCNQLKNEIKFYFKCSIPSTLTTVNFMVTLDVWWCTISQFIWTLENLINFCWLWSSFHLLFAKKMHSFVHNQMNVLCANFIAFLFWFNFFWCNKKKLYVWPIKSEFYLNAVNVGVHLVFSCNA